MIPSHTADLRPCCGHERDGTVQDMPRDADLDPLGTPQLVASLVDAAGRQLAALQQLQAVLAQAGPPPTTARPESEQVAALQREVGQLREALVSRAVVERAKGMLMQAHGMSEDQSFQLLTAVSQAHQQKVRDVAAELTTGTVDAHALTVPGRPGPAVPRLVAVPPRPARLRSVDRPGPPG